MDLAHELIVQELLLEFLMCFNPCFSGSCSRIQNKINDTNLNRRFNPCFSGSCSRITKDMYDNRIVSQFQSLF